MALVLHYGAGVLHKLHIGKWLTVAYCSIYLQKEKNRPPIQAVYCIESITI
jgi:hypothetical protein